MNPDFKCLVWGQSESSTSHLGYSMESGGELVPSDLADGVIPHGTSEPVRKKRTRRTPELMKKASSSSDTEGKS